MKELWSDWLHCHWLRNRGTVTKSLDGGNCGLIGKMVLDRCCGLILLKCYWGGNCGLIGCSIILGGNFGLIVYSVIGVGTVN